MLEGSVDFHFGGFPEMLESRIEEMVWKEKNCWLEKEKTLKLWWCCGYWLLLRMWRARKSKGSEIRY